MTFKQALKQMKQGKKVKLPSWGGYWEYEKATDKESDDRIWIHCKEGNVLEIRETDRLLYTLEHIASDEWIIADEENTPILGGVATFGFDDAIKYLKRGFKLKRKGWNGKEQYIELATVYDYFTFDGDGIELKHEDIENKAIAFVGTRGVQIGWLASQADMLAEDWLIVG